MPPLPEPARVKQVAALPIRREGSDVAILLVTTLDTGRWIIPKGWPMPDRSDPEAAAQEAWEEAGVRGTVRTESIGAYTYGKRRKRGRVTLVRVDVYLLEVTDEQPTWPEQMQRRRQWFTPAEAALRVLEPELAIMLAAVGSTI